MRKLLPLFAVCLLFLSACNTAVRSEPQGVRAVACQEEELSDGDISVTLYLREEGKDYPDQWTWSYRFEGMDLVEYDQFAAPARFEDNFSLWMIRGLDAEFDSAVLGRCINTQEEWDFCKEALIAPEYKENPEAALLLGIPEFVLRQGTECAQSTSRNPAGGEGYIDDEVYHYYVSYDGTVMRIAPDGIICTAVTPLTKEAVARLYLMHSVYFTTRSVCSPCSYYSLDQDLVLLVRRGEDQFALPREAWESFLDLVSVEADHEGPSGNDEYRDFAVVNYLYVQEEYVSPEVLRFRLADASLDPDAAPWRWFSLREDGKIVCEITSGIGSVWPYDAVWRTSAPVRAVSASSFDVSAVTAIVDSYK